MFERLETYLATVISLLGALTALLTAMQRLAMLASERHPEQAEMLAELERDVLRLEQVMNQQQEELERLRVNQPNPLDWGIET